MLRKTNLIINCVLLSIVTLIIYSVNWIIINYGNITLEEIIFTIVNPIIGTEHGLILSYIFTAFVPTVLTVVFITVLFRLIFKNISKNHYRIHIRLFKKKFSFKIRSGLAKFIVYLSLVCFILLTLLYFANRIKTFEYLKAQTIYSEFIEEHYVDPKGVDIEFPKEKRNLIYIFAESLEATYFSENQGGYYSESLMPEMYKLAKKNTSFSNTDLMGGPYVVSGTSYKSAAMVSQTAGIPVKISRALVNYNNISTYMPGAYSLGEVLEKEGYHNYLMFGSEASFGNRDSYFKSHGNYTIYDYNWAIENGKIPNDYMVWWGFEDSKLFKFAKEEITKVSKKDEPFNFTLLTVNTHHPEGYLEASCDIDFATQYENVIACSSKQIYDFVKWIQEQDFYDNTTIVIAGDHTSMSVALAHDISDDYLRTILNIYINPATKTDNIKNRVFNTNDLYPTTLASLGAEIDGERLGLRTNLFSDKKTLSEEYSMYTVNLEYSKNSEFYRHNLLNKK